MKFSQSGERLRHELASFLLHLRPSVRPRTTRGGGIRLGGGRNEAGRRRGRQKPWKTLNSGLEALQPLEISQNRQKAFFGKAWRKQTAIWKNLENKLGGRLYFAASSPSGGVAARRSRTSPGQPCKGPQRLHAVECERSLIAPQPGARPAEGAKFPRLQSLEKLQDGESLTSSRKRAATPSPRERGGERRPPTCRPAPGSRARRCRA
jgi:hypothetical protein